MIGDAAPGNVERRAVIYGGADDWQAERHIDCFAEGETLNRDQTLIVITGRDRVELAARRTHEQRVGGEGTAGFDVVSSATGFDGRRDLARFFRAEQAVLAGVRVESGDGEA